VGVFIIAKAGGSRRGDYPFVEAGEISTENTAPPLPLEETVVDMALRASLSWYDRQKRPHKTITDCRYVSKWTASDDVS
jgi:hypothetical protein